MYNLILADLFKLCKTMAIKILFGITTVSAVIMAVMAYMIPQGKIGASMTGIGFMLSDISMISILGAVIAGVFICGDFDNKTIHDAIASGCSRGEVIGSNRILLCHSVHPAPLCHRNGYCSWHRFQVQYGLRSIGLPASTDIRSWYRLFCIRDMETVGCYINLNNRICGTTDCLCTTCPCA